MPIQCFGERDRQRRTRMREKERKGRNENFMLPNWKQEFFFMSREEFKGPIAEPKSEGS